MNASTCFSQREACEWQRGCLDPCVGIQSTGHLARNQHSESDTMDVLQTFIVVFGIMDRVCTKVHYLAEFLGRDVFTDHEWGLLDVVWSTVQMFLEAVCAQAGIIDGDKQVVADPRCT